MRHSFRLLAVADWRVPNERGWDYLATIGRLTSGAMLHAIRQRRSLAPETRWADQAAVLRRVFGVHERHFFHAAPHGWLSLIETQITGGFAHFCSTGPGATRRARIAALFAACGAAPVDAGSLTRAHAVAEEAITNGRMDLIAYASASDGTDRLLVIEGKLGHEVTVDQLRKYEGALVKVADKHHLAPGPAGISLVLIGDRMTKRRRAALGQLGRWRFMTWRELVLGLERHLGEADDDDFRRFRRTLWERSA